MNESHGEVAFIDFSFDRHCVYRLEIFTDCTSSGCGPLFLRFSRVDRTASHSLDNILRVRYSLTTRLPLSLGSVC